MAGKISAVIVGAGVGGLAAGALLARRGVAVTVLEGQPFVGGRCSAFTKDGYVCDFGVHMFSLGENGPHGEVNRRISAGLTWITMDPSCRVMGAADFDFPLNILPFVRQALLALHLRISPKSLLSVRRMFTALVSGRLFEENDRVRLCDFVSAYTQDPKAHLFINCICQLYFAIDYTQASAGEFIYSFSRMFQAGSFGYPKGGCRAIPLLFAAALERAGGKILLNAPASRIVVEEGVARGVRTAVEFFPADLVISNAGLARTMDLADAGAFSEEERKKAHRMIMSNPYISIKYALKKPVIPHPVVFIMPRCEPAGAFDYTRSGTVPEDPYVFMPVPSNMDPALAPPGTQLVIAGTAAPRRASTKLCNDILDRVHARVTELFPGIAKELAWSVRNVRSDVTRLTGHPAGEAIGLAQTPDQVGSLRPSHETGVQGLYLVGADAGARGIGTEMASQSALTLCDKLAL
ncbi:MAG: FAD-dependent oxidoreductase [Thermodesulfobacteriota bacterium]